MFAFIVYTLITAVSSSRPFSPYRARTAVNVSSLTFGDSSSSRPKRMMSASSAVRPSSGPCVSTAWSASARVPACRPSRTCAFQMKSALDARAERQIASSVSAPVSDVW